MRTAKIVGLVWIALASQAIAGGGGGFGGTVFDPTNWIKNTITAEQTLQTVTELTKGNVTQLQQLLQQQMMNQGIDVAALSGYASQIKQQITSQQNFVSAAQQLYGDMSTVQANLQNRFNQAKVAGLSWQQYVTQESANSQAGNQAAIQRAQVDAFAIQKVNDDYGAVQQYESQIPASAGLQQSLQLLNSQMNRVITQNAQVLHLLAQKDLADQATEVTKNRQNTDLGGIDQEVKRQRDQTNQDQSDALSRLLQR